MLKPEDAIIFATEFQKHIRTITNFLLVCIFYYYYLTQLKKQG